MRKYNARATIQRPAAEVWRILTEPSRFPEFDPYCDKIEGELALGGTIKAFSKLSPGRAFPVKVTELVENRRMTWRGGMPLGLFEGVRTFSLTEREGRTEFEMEEVFRGPMLRLIGGSIPDMTEPFERFAEGLKAYAERA